MKNVSLSLSSLDCSFLFFFPGSTDKLCNGGILGTSKLFVDMIWKSEGSSGS